MWSPNWFGAGGGGGGGHPVVLWSWLAHTCRAKGASFVQSVCFWVMNGWKIGMQVPCHAQ